MKNNQPLFRALSLASSSLFFLGVLLAFLNYFVFPVFFNFVESANPNDRATHAILTIAAWTTVSVSTIPEMWIDVFVGRLHHHGRYGHDTTILPIWNWLQTASLLGGSIFQGAAMKRLWDDDTVYKTDFFRLKNYRLDWEELFLVSVCFMTLSGLLAVFTTGCCCCRSSSQTDPSTRLEPPNCLIQTGNAIFLAWSIVMVFAVLIDGFEAPGAFSGTFAVVGAYGGWCVAGILWIVADYQLPRVTAVDIIDEEVQE